MTIKIGDTLPDMAITIATNDGPKPSTTGELFAGKKIALLAVPGAFTPTCSARHLPSYIDNLALLKAQGIDEIFCISVNDAFVMNAWAKSQNITTEVTMLADGNGLFTKALGLELDASGFGMGTRSQRYSLVADNSEVSSLFIEQGGEYKVSSAEYMLENL